MTTEPSRRRTSADDGYALCPTCDGRGFCHWCHGEGTLAVTAGRCSACGGSGQCPVCEGDGQLPEDHYAFTDFKDQRDKRKCVRIRDLDFGALIRRIVQSVDIATREVGDPSTRATLTFVNTPADAVRRLRGKIASAAASEVSSPEELHFERGLVEAFVRMHHHPLATAGLGAVHANQGSDMGPRLLEIAVAHPDAKFALSAVQQALVRAILAHGDHELDDKELPWLMHWNKASAAAGALTLFVTLERLGDIVVDEHEKAEYDREVEQFNRTKSIPPSKLVK